jgi:hypothetical protein
MKSDVDRDALQELLENLETRLKAYLVEWRREHGIRGASESGIDRIERLPAATEREREHTSSTRTTSTPSA